MKRLIVENGRTRRITPKSHVDRSGPPLMKPRGTQICDDAIEPYGEVVASTRPGATRIDCGGLLKCRLHRQWPAVSTVSAAISVPVQPEQGTPGNARHMWQIVFQGKLLVATSWRRYPVRPITAPSSSP